jgi:hypothetical protein
VHKPLFFSAKSVSKNAGNMHFEFRGWFGADNGLRGTLADFSIK